MSGYKCIEKESCLTLEIGASLDAANSGQLFSALLGEFLSRRPKRVEVDLRMVEKLDDFGIAALISLKKEVHALGCQFTLGRLSEHASDIFASVKVHGLDQGRIDHASDDVAPSLFIRLGEATLNGVDGLVHGLTFLGETCFSFIRAIKHPAELRYSDMLVNMRRVGVDALPIVGLISFLLGLIMAFMSSVQLKQFGANIYVASLVGLSMTRELGPIMTAIIVAGRSASAFAAEIGTMKISEEIDALTIMGIDPIFFLAMPRILAAFLVVPLLTLFSDLFAIAGGLVVGISMLDLTMDGYINQTIKTLSLFDVYWGVGKSALFALLISWIGCLRGFQVSEGASGVGRATTSAVVSSIFMIILTDSLLVVVLRYWG